MSIKNRIYRTFSNRRADDNSVATGRLALGVLAASVLLAVIFSVFSFFLSTSKDLRQQDRERRQEQKDSISFNVQSDNFLA